MLGRVTQTPAGWFPDPQMPGQLRYWDGAGWTAHTQPGGMGAALPNAEGAVASLVLGIVSLVACGFLTGIPAMVVGRKAVKAVDASNGRYGGRGLAQAGFWTGLVGTAYTGLITLVVIGVFVFGSTASDSFQETCSSVQGGSTNCE
jgi:hypothetical protein